MLCRPDLKLRLMLQSRAKYTVFVVCQSYQRNFCDGLEMKLTPPLDRIQHAGETAGKETAEKALLLILLPVSDYKRAYKFVFHITNFHTELKPQVKASHSMNSPVFGL